MACATILCFPLIRACLMIVWSVSDGPWVETRSSHCLPRPQPHVPPRYPPCALRTRCRSCTENWAAKPWQKSFVAAVEGSRVTEIVVGGENVVANHRLANLLRHGVQKQAGHFAESSFQEDQSPRCWCRR